MTLVTLDDVLAEELVLIDGCVKSRTGFLTRIYGTRNGSSLNTRVMRDEIRDLQYFLDILGRDNIQTIPQVSGQFRVYYEKVRGRLRYFYGLHGRDIDFGNGNRDIFKSHRKFKKRSTKNLKLLRQLTHSVEQVYNSLTGMELDTTGPAYEILVDMVKNIASVFELKQDTAPLYGLPPTKPSDKDERLVASAYWVSMNSDIAPAIFTSDTNFKRIIGVTPYLMGNRDFLPYNQDFVDAIAERAPKLYLSWVSMNGKDKITRLLAGELKGLRVIHPTRKESLMLHENLYSLWQQFLKYQDETKTYREAEIKA